MTPAIVSAKAAGIAFTVHQLEVGQDSGREAAAHLGLPPERLFKTVVVKIDGARLAVVVLPITSELDRKELAAAIKAKRSALASPDEAERATGYRIGAISPLGQRQNLPTFLDRSALDFATICVSAGRRGLELELSPSALQSACKAEVLSIASPKTAA